MPRPEPRLALLEYAEHRGVQDLVRALNRAYRSEPALWERDFDWTGFRWLEPDDIDNSVVSFVRLSADGSRSLVCVANLTPVARSDYRVGLHRGGRWRELLNTDSIGFGGGGVANEDIHAEGVAWQGEDHSAALTLPPLAVVWLVPAHQVGIEGP